MLRSKAVVTNELYVTVLDSELDGCIFTFKSLGSFSLKKDLPNPFKGFEPVCPTPEGEPCFIVITNQDFNFLEPSSLEMFNHLTPQLEEFQRTGVTKVLFSN